MKTITITCDHCKSEINGDHIEIRSENGQDFKYSNTLCKISGINGMQSYRDLHFCSKDHFVDFFFGLDYSKKGCEPEQKYCTCWNTDGRSTQHGIICIKCNLIKP